MARLIPSFTDDRTPPGERELFGLLAGGPDDWVVLHSLDLSPWNRSLRTEIDFVAIDPEVGLLCIEVKSQCDLHFDGYGWFPSTIVRSPFKQASDARYALRRRLAEVAPRFKHVPIAHCCIFPRASFALSPNLSVQPWELMDGRAYSSLGSGIAFCRDLKARIKQTIAADAQLRPLERPLTQSDVEALISFCVPVQRFRPSAREQVARREQEIAKVLLGPQKRIIELAELNDRLIVAGPAGTGKTLIAMEVARRFAEQGRRVALLCYNHLVGDWMARHIASPTSQLPNLLVGRAIRVMAEMAGLTIPASPSSAYWEVELPEALEERLTDPDFRSAALFDYLVLDEAQDLLGRPRLWQCLTQFLLGGADRGAFALFGDFDHQVLAQREPMRQALASLNVPNRPTRARLLENCRNYRIVGETAVKLAGLDSSIYSAFLRLGGGVQNYDIFFYDRDQTQLDKLKVWLKEFALEGYKPSDITLLSFRADDASAALRLKGEGLDFRPARLSGNASTYASVQAFKGLENKVIVLTDVRLADNEFHRDLLYTGMTRATEIVRVLCEMGSQRTLNAWITGGRIGGGKV